MLSMIVLNKILAIQIGPSGLSFVGQLQNIITACTVISSAGFSTGVTKYTAEYKTDATRRREVWVTAVSTGAMSSLLLAIGIIFFQNELTSYLFPDSDHSSLFLWLALVLLFYSVNQFLLATINGMGEVNLYITSNITGSLIALLTTGILTYALGLAGALVGFILNQAFACIATIAFARKKAWFQMDNFLGHADGASLKKLSKYSMAAIATSVVAPITMMFIRSLIINTSGIVESGHWEAANRISSIYLAFISTPMAIYFLPKLSQASDRHDIVSEITYGLLLLVPATVFMAASIFFSRFIIIEVLFSPEFLPMERLLAWQLIGDVLRVVAWLFSTFLLSRAKIKEFVISELGVNFSFAVFAVLLVAENGAEGACIAYILSTLIYILLLILFFFPSLPKEGTRNAI
jgi:PST family polysaccharide transporter